MSSGPEGSREPAPTVIIERPTPPGCLRRLTGPLLAVSLLGNLALVGGRSAGIVPEPLEERYLAGPIAESDKVAVVEVEGVIAGSAVEDCVRQVRQARADDAVRAVVLRVDTPGGTVTGSDRIWREVVLLKRTGKPVVVSMGGLATSGGYYVSAPADLILAEPTTSTGSIGVVLELPNVAGLLDKVGVEMHAVTAGAWKDAGSPFEPLSDRDRARFQELIDETYGRFLRVVAQGRKLSLERARGVADGKVYSADEALANGLVDRIGYLDDAIREAVARAGLDRARVVTYDRTLSLSDALLGLRGRVPARGLALDEGALLELRTPRLLMLLR